MSLDLERSCLYLMLITHCMITDLQLRLVMS